MENCLTSDTVVVTINGNKPLCEVVENDLLWDGGRVGVTQRRYRPRRKEVGTWMGIELTSNHKILGSSGWKTAGEMDNDNFAIRALPGARFGALTVLWSEPGKSGRTALRCDCGRDVTVFTDQVYKGRAKLCHLAFIAIRGRESKRKASRKVENQKLWSLWVHRWSGILSRCRNPKKQSL